MEDQWMKRALRAEKELEMEKKWRKEEVGWFKQRVAELIKENADIKADTARIIDEKEMENEEQKEQINAFIKIFEQGPPYPRPATVKEEEREEGEDGGRKEREEEAERKDTVKEEEMDEGGDEAHLQQVDQPVLEGVDMSEDMQERLARMREEMAKDEEKNLFALRQSSLEQLKNQLQTAVENRDKEKATRAIEELELDIISRELLETTRIGVDVNKWRKAMKEMWPALSKRCRGLIEKWQKVMKTSPSPARNLGSGIDGAE
ncbi:hypothetical protein PMAYCL1PPCAC_31585 [Pristionchus mayeri]|uniref:TFIIS N-terminal domain-containing protein n=1 Tax=Pristionchus mayeri TaxID=1317129 RepID=A0AAN5DFZ5_9BILA|nr:hypothetical protein PMAYCL1PPCAC_31585 [Pristionchus mayeri]